MTVSMHEDRALADFGLAVSFVGTQAVIEVRGEVDLMSAPEFAAVVDAVIDRGHRSVVLDLSALDFMDAAGLEVIAEALRRVQPWGGDITVRAASALVLRMLDITELTALVHLELAHAGVSDEELAGRLQDALRGEEVIAQAQGVIMEREGVGEEDAHAILADSAQNAASPLREQAEDVLATTRRDLPSQPVGL